MVVSSSEKAHYYLVGAKPSAANTGCFSSSAVKTTRVACVCARCFLFCLHGSQFFKITLSFTPVLVLRRVSSCASSSRAALRALGFRAHSLRH